MTPLEEMAIAETPEMGHAMAQDFEVTCSALLVNCASPMCAATEAAIASLGLTENASPAMQFAVNRGLIERDRCSERSAALPLPLVLIPRITQSANDLDLLATIGQGMELSQFS